MSTFNMTNFGFFLYPIGRGTDTCHTIAAPRVSFLQHVVGVLVDPDHTEVPAQLPTEPGPGGQLCVDLEGHGLRFPSRAPASLGRRMQGTSNAHPDFDWIPDFTNTCCGVKLSPGWHTRGHFVSRVELGGGELRAVADKHTCTEEWHWTLCDGTPHRQRVTTKTVYSLPEVTYPFDVEVVRLSDSSPIGVIRFREAEPEPIYFHVPKVVFDDITPAAGHVEASHVIALLGLCSPNGDPLGVPPKSREPRSCETAAIAPIDALTFLERRHNGTPECSNAVMVI
jgi:hypothetical protein